jgi:hypothetical protein
MWKLTLGYGSGVPTNELLIPHTILVIKVETYSQWL